MNLDLSLNDVSIDELLEDLINRYGPDAGADDCSGNFNWDLTEQ